jgi:DNA-3-methyladenine glycosylase
LTGPRSRTAARSSNGRPSRRLGRAFFDRSTVDVARALLGTVLSVRGPDGRRRVRLVETEAYVANDPANHAYRGPTARNRSMFSRPGTLYVYRIHQVVCANLVTRRGEAVLLRAGEPLTPNLANPSGPGRLCRALGLSVADDGTDVTESRRIALAARAAAPLRVVVGARIGIRRATRRRLRFALAGNEWVSRPRPPAWTLSRRDTGRRRDRSAGGRSRRRER